MNRSEYDHTKLRGWDADLETSLKEYGFAWIETETEVLFYYGISHDGEEFKMFDFCSFDRNTDVRKEFNWADFEDVEDYTGDRPDNFIQQVTDLYDYYGYENVFGSSYWEGLTYEEVVNP